MTPEPLTIEWFLAAIGNRPQLPVSVLGIPGFATPNLRQLLNSVCGFDGCRYLEVGTLHGASLIAAAYRNGGRFTGIDDFSLFDGSEESLNKTLFDFKDECNTYFLNKDALTIPTCGIFPLPEIAIGRINVLFYDGDHSEDVTRDVITRFAPILADRFVLIVDDYSWIGPRRGADAAINSCGWNVECKVEIADNYNRRGFGVGLMLALIEKRKRQ